MDYLLRRLITVLREEGPCSWRLVLLDSQAVELASFFGFGEFAGGQALDCFFR